MARLEVRLQGGGVREIAAAEDGRSLAEILAAHDLPLNTRCGQRGRCRGCEVDLRAGALRIGDKLVAAPATIPACLARLSGPAVLHLPARSHIGRRPQVGDTFEIAVSYAHQPLFPPAAGPRDTAFAVDVGTTTVALLLVDLATGEILSRAGAFNEQIRFGDNVITRIEAAAQPGNLAALQRAIVRETLQPLLAQACQRAGRGPERLAGGAIAGNTTMLHLLAGEDPASLGFAPFTPKFLAGRQMAAGEIGLAAAGLAAETPIQLLPGLAAYIGADLAAGVVATGLAYDPTPSLLVDIGTNGEMVLQTGGKLRGCATAAGPAFEGCGLCCGTRARDGAVSDLRLGWNPFRLDTEVIGQVSLAQANGLCGSAYLDFLAAARRGGLLRATGRFEPSVWEALPTEHRYAEAGERAFRIVAHGGRDDLRVSEADVARLLQAKAAIGAGIEILLKSAGIQAAEVGRVCLAGGFGMHLNVAHAIAIGLLPGFREHQVRGVGNTALAGAWLALVDRTLLQEMEDLRAQVEVIELNLVDGFEDRYIEHLMLP